MSESEQGDTQMDQTPAGSPVEAQVPAESTDPAQTPGEPEGEQTAEAAADAVLKAPAAEVPEEAEGQQTADAIADAVLKVPAPEEVPAEPEPVVEPVSTVSEDGEGDDLLVTPGMDWFVLRVASNKEDSVRQTLLRKIKIETFEHLVNRILVPTEKIKTMKGGKQRITERKLYPGYVFVEMKLEDDGRIPQDVFFLIKETTGVGDFIGTAGRPAPMQRHEVEKMIEASKKPEEQPEVKMEFAPGDPVKIKEGPFENMDAVVDVLLPDQGKVRVVVTIFGRATPVEMEYWLIEKADQ